MAVCAVMSTTDQRYIRLIPVNWLPPFLPPTRTIIFIPLNESINRNKITDEQSSGKTTHFIRYCDFITI